MKRAAKRSRVVPLFDVIRSDEWASRDPKFYLRKLKPLCRVSRDQAYDPDLVALFAVGADLWSPKDPRLEYFQAACLREIQKLLAVRGTVFDPLFQAYNLVTRVIERAREPELGAA